MDSLAHLDEGLTCVQETHSSKHVAVIGGGYAGMAAAVTLAQNGVKVTVYEAGGVLGGRARQLSHAQLDTPLDNGQHLLLGAYQTTLALARLVNPNTTIWLQQPLTLHSENGLQLSAPQLPAPFNTLLALLTAHGISTAQRWAAIAFMLQQRLRGFKLKQDCSVVQLLAKQPDVLIKLLWEPLCLAALNTPIATASAQVFLNVLRDSLTRSQHDSDLIIPSVDLSAFFPTPAADYVRQRGGSVNLHQRIRHISASPDGYTIDGNQHSHVICAVAAHQVAALISKLPELAPIAQQLKTYSYQPITTVYLQYPPHIRLPRPMTGLTDTIAQWVFDRGITHQQHGLLAVVISTAGAHSALDHATLATRIAAELQQTFATPPTAIWHQVIVEKRATFACDVDLPRPAQHTALANFHLAGDYTASDYPATLEAATQSGVKCAHLILATNNTH
ncbi:hydroxysqualene dehydroxylase HpnE [Sulfuriferula thiophila]|uniref:hydroxysqualene dehydroxylase HpnE n=1 Tax=Sulfuriferula thiophila TaxID=1781211 RepID=UPI001CB8E2B3|nr:hydroxysqualene dehydroxylase HpnE [Sulfuriferula thiophila]